MPASRGSQSTIIGSMIVLVIVVIFGIAVLSWGVMLFNSQQSGLSSLYMSEYRALSDNYNIEEVYINSSSTMTVWIGNYGQSEVQVVSVIVYNDSYSYLYRCSVVIPPGGLGKITVSGLNVQRDGVYSVKVVASDGSSAVIQI
ncbi:MAG: hypothetical protein ACP5GH_04120 [Nitrososphaeria archaeon]